MFQKLLSEFIGTAFLLMAIVGSGIMADNLDNGLVAVALLAHAIAIGGTLYVLIVCLGPISGAHFNPAVSFGFWLKGHMTMPTLLAYVAVQVVAALTGAILAHIMFELAPIQIGETARTGVGQWVGELIATFGLMLFILLSVAADTKTVPATVGLYITAAIWFTSSTSFANPAVSVARAFTGTFTAIDPAHVPVFIIAQVVGAAAAVGAARILVEEEAVDQA